MILGSMNAVDEVNESILVLPVQGGSFDPACFRVENIRIRIQITLELTTTTQTLYSTLGSCLTLLKY